MWSFPNVELGASNRMRRYSGFARSLMHLTVEAITKACKVLPSAHLRGRENLLKDSSAQGSMFNIFLLRSISFT